jgi:hypothetical protein
MEILRYKLSGDRKGLRAYFRTTEGKLTFYHIHSDELTPLEKWIKKLLIRK